MTRPLVRQLCHGSVQRVVGAEVDIRGLRLAVGDAVVIEASGGQRSAEVVAVDDGGVKAVVVGTTMGLARGDQVRPDRHRPSAPVGDALLGRVLNGLGQPIDGRGPVQVAGRSIDAKPPPAMQRRRITEPLATGVRVVDGLATLGRGQRLGIFAGSGVGKSTLLAMMVRGTNADRCVIALIGERGREVREFIEDVLGPEGLARSVVVVATSDEPALARVRAALVALTIAEQFADDGHDVLLTLDSITRIAAAQREIGLAAGEPPTTRGYPPSVFALLPRLLERAGPRIVGTVTALVTVLVEGGDHDEPVADTVRGILDGHLVLDRELTNRGHFPAVDPLASLSRLATTVTTAAHQSDAQAVRTALAARHRVRDLVELGAYARGSDPAADAALDADHELTQWLQQDAHQIAALPDTLHELSLLATRVRPTGSATDPDEVAA